MNVNRLWKRSLFAVPCAALLLFACSEPETIPGGAQNADQPARPVGNPAAPPADGGGQPGEPGGPEAGAMGGEGGETVAAIGPKNPAEAAGNGEKPVVGDPQPAADGDVPKRVEAPAGDIWTGDISKHPCGDGNCDDAESKDPKLCPRDCSTEKPPGGDWCGDGICDAREQAEGKCAKDCGKE